jgi:hypothetical protein
MTRRRCAGLNRSNQAVRQAGQRQSLAAKIRYCRKSGDLAQGMDEIFLKFHAAAISRLRSPLPIPSPIP